MIEFLLAALAFVFGLPALFAIIRKWVNSTISE